VPWQDVVAEGRLTFIQSSAAGLDHCLHPSVIDSGIVVCSASGLFANQVAEQTLALLLGFCVASQFSIANGKTKSLYVGQPMTCTARELAL
jgi:D-3-phosphoglycerate dehydrogenase